MGDMDAYRDVFLAESTDFLQQVTDGLLALESSPNDTEPVEVVFRGAHSLKGMAAAMGYSKTADLTHKMEGLMDQVRKGHMGATLDVINVMLAAVDLVRDLIDDESAGSHEVDPSEMISTLESMAASGAAAVDVSVPPSEAVIEAGLDAVPSAPAGAVGSTDEQVYRATVRLEETCVLKAVRAYMVIKRLSHMGRVIETLPAERDIEDEKFDLTFEVVVATAMDADAVKQAAEFVTEIAEATVVESGGRAVSAEVRPEEPETPGARRKQVSGMSQSQTVRVSIGHLDTLVDLVGELVILRSRLERIAGERQDAELSDTVDDLQSISTDLQYEVMLTRMVPVGNIFNRFPRMVRDLAVDLGKRIEFQMNGLDIELDRTVLDEIGDPLVHLLRNSIDHGIESAEERRASGKPEVGMVTLSAGRERDHVVISVKDDGKGIDPERIWTSACERGLVSPSERQDYSESDVLQLTCLPGFSTAETATRVSGRGVGMDAVKGKVEFLGGTIQIKSEVGAGTEFIMRLPLTLAIMQSLLVEANGQSFALPLSAVNEVISAEDVSVETVDGHPVLILRDGEVVPLQRLDAILFGGDPHAMPEPRSSIVLVQSGAEQYALQVEGIGGRQEVVVKPLSRLFRDQKGFSGATILGDGRVMLILDPRVLSSTEV